MSPSALRFAIVTGTAISLAFMLTSSAAAVSSHRPASVSQLPAALQSDLANHPGGKIVNSREISFDKGHILVGVATSAALDVACPNGWVCLNTDPNYAGTFAKFDTPLDKNIPVAGYLGAPVKSLRNYRSYGSILSNGKGGTICYPSDATAPDIGSPYSGYPYLYLEHADNC